ncbi:MAG: biotin/lipoyl-binding protein [Cyanobacteria bacterium J06559_3]
MTSEHLSSDHPFESEPSAVSPTEADAAEDQTVEPVAANRPALPSFHKPKRPLWPATVLAMLMVTSFVGWRIYTRLIASPGLETTETTRAQARLPVSVIQAPTGSVAGWVFDEGTAWPVQRRVLNFQASGDVTYVTKVSDVDLREGDVVAQGQLLATIDSRRQNSSLETAAADIQISENQRNQSAATLLQAQANLEKAESDLALAQTELRRYQALFEQGAVAESDRDVYQNQVAQAEAALKTARQDVRSAEEGVRSAEATITSSQARLNEVAVDLEDTQLVSPIDGIVAYINIREGEYWDPQYLDRSSAQSAIETAPIVVMNPQSFEVELEIQADAAGEIRAGQRAYVVLEEEVSAAQATGANRQDLLSIAQQRGSEGVVFAVSPSQTPGGRGIEVAIRDFQQVRNLKVGGQAYVWIETAVQTDTVVLPLGALVARDQQFYAFVVNQADGTVQRRRVTRGIEGLSGVEILSGVEPGELVVVEGQNRLVDGTPVEIVNQQQGNREADQ